MMSATDWSDLWPVSGSVADTWKSLRPRRSGTTWLQVPSAPAVTCTVWFEASVTLTVPCGIVTPWSVYVVAVSSTVLTALAGSVTEIVGGLLKRSTWMARYPTDATSTRVMSALTMIAGEEVRPCRGAALRRGEGEALPRCADLPRHDDDRFALRAVAPLASPLDEDLVRFEAEIEGVV